jgi:hypothetical protein
MNWGSCKPQWLSTVIVAQISSGAGIDEVESLEYVPPAFRWQAVVALRI